jgi:hypothetical protein
MFGARGRARHAAARVASCNRPLDATVPLGPEHEAENRLGEFAIPRPEILPHPREDERLAYALSRC